MRRIYTERAPSRKDSEGERARGRKELVVWHVFIANASITQGFLDMKRLIGRTFSSKSVQDDIKRWPFKVVQTRHGTPHVQVHYHGEEQLKTPQEVSAMVSLTIEL